MNWMLGDIKRRIHQSFKSHCALWCSRRFGRLRHVPHHVNSSSL